MLKQTDINAGGVQGTGSGRVDTSHQDVQALRQAIQEKSAGRSPLQKAEDQLLGIRFQMEDYLNHDSPANIVPVGHFLRACLEAIGIKHKDFAQYINMEGSNLSALFAGRRKINLDLAIQLGSIFGIPAILWLQVQSYHELIKLTSRKSSKRKRLSLKGLLAKAG